MNPSEIAKTWLGTPYKHQQSLKGYGCDCLGLLRGVWSEWMQTPAEEPPVYSPSWGERRGRGGDLMLIAAEKYLVPSPPSFASVLVFRMAKGAAAKHCGIVCSQDSSLGTPDLVVPSFMIHAKINQGVVYERLNDYWLSRVVGRYSFPKGPHG